MGLWEWSKKKNKDTDGEINSYQNIKSSGAPPIWK